MHGNMGEQPSRPAPPPRWPPRAAHGPPARPPTPLWIPGQVSVPVGWPQPPRPPGFPAWNAPPPPRILRPPPRPPFYRGLPAVRPPPPPRLGFRGNPPRPAVPDTDASWLEAFQRTHCSSQPEETRPKEPPLRLLRRRVAEAQALATRLQAAAGQVAAIDKRLSTLANNSVSPSDDAQASEPDGAAERVEASRLRVQRERKLLMCEALKRELDAATAASGLFSEAQLADFRAFAARVQKKKAYRERARSRRRAEASLHRAVGAQAVDVASQPSPGGPDQDTEPETPSKGSTRGQAAQQSASVPSSSPRLATGLETARAAAPRPRPAPTWALDPQSLSLDGLVAVRRAWDRHVVPPRTPGASAIPPHFVPPPRSPCAQWAQYAVAECGR